MAKSLTTEEQQCLHHRYKQNDLYRQWLPILTMLHRDVGVLEPTLMWALAERQIARLRKEETFREHEIAPIYTELLDHCGERRSADTVMCIMLTMLMNAVEKGHEDEHFDNEPMCIAILDIMGSDPYHIKVMELFKQRQTGYDGKPIVITPFDPMKNPVENATADEKNKKPELTPQQQAVKAFVDEIIQLTNKAYETYNGQSMSPAANQPEVKIVIQKEQLVQCLQDKMKSDFEGLLEGCYPVDGKTKRRKCQFVRKLMDDGGFGKLPKKMLAQLLAPIVELSVGCTATYLSKK